MTSIEHTEGYYLLLVQIKNIQNRLILKFFTLDILLIISGIEFHIAIP